MESSIETYILGKSSLYSVVERVYRELVRGRESATISS